VYHCPCRQPTAGTDTEHVRFLPYSVWSRLQEKGEAQTTRLTLARWWTGVHSRVAVAS